MIETTILNVIGTTVVLGAIAFALALIHREIVRFWKLKKAQKEIDEYCLVANEMASIAKEDGSELSRDDLMKIKAMFDDMCPTAVELGMYINYIKLKDDE